MDKDQEIAALKAEVAELKAMLAEALATIAKLQKNSGNSSKPPSSDIVKPKPQYKARKTKKRKAGGQKGRKACARVPFPPEEVDRSFDHVWEGIDPDRYRLLPGKFSIDQQVELVDRPFVVTEHRFQKYLDQQTGKIIVTPRPGEVRLGLFGPRLLALTSCLKADLHGSYAAIQTLYHDAFGLTVSTGYLAKSTGKVAHALAGTYDQLKTALRVQPVVHVDETGHKERGERWWTWLGTSRDVTLLQIIKGRGTDQLHQLLGDDFEGVLCSDHFSAYVKNARLNPKVKPQFCWAHLVRDFRFVAESGDRSSRGWAKKVLEDAGRMFTHWHGKRHRACRKALDVIMNRCRNPGVGLDANRLGKRVWKHRESYRRFIDEPELHIEPTNNSAERQLRPSVIHRGITQGTRSEAGRRWWERVFSVRATCRQHERSLFVFLAEVVEAMAGGKPIPRLV